MVKHFFFLRQDLTILTKLLLQVMAQGDLLALVSQVVETTTGIDTTPS